MLLRRLQELLAGIYDVHVEHDVRDFVTSDRGFLPEHARASGTDEQLLVEGGGEQLGVALFLDQALLARLERTDPLGALHGGNIGDWWTALEGVSHFVCVAWNAHHDRDVSLLELELQAEIDKYVATFSLLRRQAPGHFPHELHRILFGRTHVDPQLPPARAALYRRASAYAARFCRRIETRLRRPAEEASREMTAELRRFYRLTEARKLAHIERCA